MATQITSVGSGVQTPLAALTAGSAPLSAEQLLQADGPAATGADGWTPAQLRYVRASGAQGRVNAALEFINEPTQERPGQRLSQAMVTELAPFFAAQFRVDESFVRKLLSEVYVYVGGVSHGEHMATTNGTHMFVPSEDSTFAIYAAMSSSS